LYIENGIIEIVFFYVYRDKAVAVTYPLKSSIWVTQKRAFYICCFTVITLSSANLSFIKYSGILVAKWERKYCGLNKESVIVDILTASVLPMGMCLSLLI
jgi:hypothetical protein